MLGGGIGGALAAMELSRKLDAQAEITLVDREGRHYFPPSYPWLMMGWRRPSQLWRPLSRLKAKNVKLRQEEVTAIDSEERLVATKTGRLSYDHLLISMGAQL
ncbi:MAG: NAD(P)/FAD-dependent oxidoreductase, partial [Candidatus Thermoplasmatota archaeon]|nr:NAD(P)/FAD-dependent oxidoreductase [Candidatus Thermoplasmatota archaeon]